MLTDPIEQLILDLSQSPRVREFLSVDTERDARERIYIDGLPEPPPGNDEQTETQRRNTRPYILIYPSEADSYKIVSIASPSCTRMTGAIEVVLSRDYPLNKTPTEAWREIAGQIGQICKSDDPAKPGLLNYLGQPERLQIKEITVDMYGRTPVSERVNYGDAYDVIMGILF